jgi:DNA-binding MarR family transcriptional regulator
MSGPGNGADIAQDVYTALTKTFLLLDDFDRRFFASFGLSARQFWALTHLDELNGRPMVELGQLLLTDKSNVTGIVDRLEKMGLAMRTVAPHDRRVMMVKLTAKGRDVRELINGRHAVRVGELLSAMGDEQLHDLRKHLGAVSRHLERHLRRAEPAAAAR